MKDPTAELWVTRYGVVGYPFRQLPPIGYSAWLAAVLQFFSVLLEVTNPDAACTFAGRACAHGTTSASARATHDAREALNECTHPFAHAARAHTATTAATGATFDKECVWLCFDDDRGPF
jgi:hypothetical protein